MTFSITAHDHATGRGGVAVRSRVLVVGTRVPLVRAAAAGVAVLAAAAGPA